MKQLLFSISILIGTTNLLYSQSILPPPNDTIKPISPPIRIFGDGSDYAIEFTPTSSSIYSISIEKNGEEIFSDKFHLVQAITIS